MNFFEWLTNNTETVTDWTQGSTPDQIAGKYLMDTKAIEGHYSVVQLLLDSGHIVAPGRTDLRLLPYSR